MEKWCHTKINFSHDWLRNIYLRSLDSFIKQIHYVKPDIEFLKEKIKSEIPEIELKYNEATWLIENCESEMSPRQYFISGPLSKMNNDSKEWMSNLIHSMWLFRYNIHVLLERGRQLLKEILNNYQVIISKTKNIEQWRHEDFQHLYDDVVKLRQNCKEFSNVLSELPDEIKIT